MEKLRSYMMWIGGFITLAGIFSILLVFVGKNLRMLLWIDWWGQTVGWIIRIGIVLLGGVLILISTLSENRVQ